MSPSQPSFEAPYAGIRRRSRDLAQATVAEYTFEPMATFPMHRHPQEQIVVVQRGELRLSIRGRTESLSTGQWSAIASGVDHGITAGAEGASFLAILVPRRRHAETFTLMQATTPE